METAIYEERGLYHWGRWVEGGPVLVGMYHWGEWGDCKAQLLGHLLMLHELHLSHLVYFLCDVFFLCPGTVPVFRKPALPLVSVYVCSSPNPVPRESVLPQ